LIVVQLFEGRLCVHVRISDLFFSSLSSISSIAQVSTSAEACSCVSLSILFHPQLHQDHHQLGVGVGHGVGPGGVGHGLSHHCAINVTTQVVAKFFTIELSL
jgi:hypothetical protein